MREFAAAINHNFLVTECAVMRYRFRGLEASKRIDRF